MKKNTLNKIRLKIPSLIDKTIKLLENVKNKYYSLQEELKYTSLSPVDTKDSNCEYSKALKWALDNRQAQDIKNIALTGPYGAGKSTILKTLLNNYSGNKLKFLSISLATFKEEKPLLDDNGSIIQVDKTELLKRIEISILEQIFYNEKDSKIPDSRFKKIKSYSLKNIIFLSIGYLFFVLAAYNYYNPHFIHDIFKDFPLNTLVSNFIHYGSFLILAIGLFFIISKSIRLISAITINKIMIQNAEIGIGDSLNKSILNHHIDELLYFFSQTKCNVVIIEDLDRFEETEIFTKLREINLLLNNSKKTKHLHITFIYAVRDNIFKDKERTKFFDFIVPVIPYINSSNSSDKLLNKAKNNNFVLSNNLIEDISFYIDDMRLLHNITNEFYLYCNKIVGVTDYNKLFALITYKNIYPSDFMELSNNKSVLNIIFNQKSDFINALNENIDLKIIDLKEQIKNYDSLFIRNLEDLRRLYIVRLIENSQYFDSFIINDSVKKIDEIIKDDIFPYIVSNNYKYNKITSQYGHHSVYSTPIAPDVTFSSIEDLVDNVKKYSSKEEEIIKLNAGEINVLKQKIQDLEKEKQQNRNLELAELLQTNQIQNIKFGKNCNQNFDKDFILMLLRNGYTTEDYMDYITLFHGESITRDDYQFHINIKNKINLPFDFKLHKIEKLITKINPLDFQTEYILNYQLMDYLLGKPIKHSKNLEGVFSKLKDESKISIDFIKGYFKESKKLEEFIKILCNNWSNIYKHIGSDTGFTSEMKNDIFKSIIEFADIDAIKNISNNSTFKQIILDNSEFLNISLNNRKLTEIIKALEIKFTSIDFNNSSDELLTYIYENNHYKLNVKMVTSLIKKFGKFNQVKFDNSNYQAIKDSNANQLIQYVENNINEYIENVYLKIETNINEEERHLTSLLNNEAITIGNKESIIISTKTKIKKLDSITYINLYPILFQNNKVKPFWENLLYAYNNQETQTNDDESEIELEISQFIIDFINIKDNAEELSKVKIPKEVNGENIYSVFWKKIIQIDEINDDIYEIITKSNPWWYKDLKFDEISDNKIKTLINNNCLNPSTDTFNALKENSEGLNIYFLEKRKSYYFKILDELDFESDDLELILKSVILTNYEKQQLLNRSTSETVITDNNLKLLSEIIIKDNTFIVEESVLKALLNSKNISVIDRIQLYNKNYNKFDNIFIDNYLENLGGNYAEITNKSKKAKIPNNKDNKILLNNLISKDYISSISTKDNSFIVNHKRS